MTLLSVSMLSQNCLMLSALVFFDLKSLEIRRLRCDLIQYYKILTRPNLSSLNSADYFKLHYPLISARDASAIIVKPVHYTNRVLSGCFYSIDTLTVGIAYRLACIISSHCSHSSLLYIRITYA